MSEEKECGYMSWRHEVPCTNIAEYTFEDKRYCSECISDAVAQMDDSKDLSFTRLRAANKIRCDHNFENHSVGGWEGSDWGNAMAGEYGEVSGELLEIIQLVLKFNKTLQVCDTIKKGMRQLEGDPSFEEIKVKLGKEIADVVIYSDLLSQRFGIDLCEMVRQKFNEVSDKRDCPIYL